MRPVAIAVKTIIDHDPTSQRTFGRLKTVERLNLAEAPLSAIFRFT